MKVDVDEKLMRSWWEVDVKLMKNLCQKRDVYESENQNSFQIPGF